MIRTSKRTFKKKSAPPAYFWQNRSQLDRKTSCKFWTTYIQTNYATSVVAQVVLEGRLSVLEVCPLGIRIYFSVGGFWFDSCILLSPTLCLSVCYFRSDSLSPVWTWILFSFVFFTHSYILLVYGIPLLSP